MSLDASDLNLPGDLEILRDRATAALARGETLDALYAELAERDPMALMDLTMGPKGLSGPGAFAAGWTIRERLHSHAKPLAVLRRLVQLAGDSAESEAMVLKLVPSLRSKAEGEAIRSGASGLPKVQALLELVLPGMVA